MIWSGHVTCDLTNLVQIAGRLYLPSSLSRTPLVNQAGSLSKIRASSMMTSCSGLSLLMCRDNSEEVELGLLCSKKRGLVIFLYSNVGCIAFLTSASSTHNLINRATDFFWFQSIFRLTQDFLELSCWLDVCLNVVRIDHSFDLLRHAFHIGDADCRSFRGPSLTGVGCTLFWWLGLYLKCLVNCPCWIAVLM